MKRWLIFGLVFALILALASPALATKASGGKSYKKPQFVSHPYLKKSKVKASTDFKVWGYVKPVLAASTPATLTVTGQRYSAATATAKASWEATDCLTAKAQLSATGKFKKKTNYSTKLSCDTPGRYRVRAVLVWTDPAGIERTKKSSWKYLRIVK